MEKHQYIEETLAHLVRPQAKMVEEGCHVWYVFSREEYEFLANRMEFLVAAAKEILADVRKDLEGYASQFSGDVEMVDKIKGLLEKATGTYNACKNMCDYLIELLDHSPHRVKDKPKVYTSMAVDAYRMFILACIGFYLHRHGMDQGAHYTG
jgi:hypothetical protein